MISQTLTLNSVKRERTHAVIYYGKAVKNTKSKGIVKYKLLVKLLNIKNICQRKTQTRVYLIAESWRK